MTTNTDINLNQASCIKEQDNFTYTRYVNVCTNKVSDVPRGSLAETGLIVFALVIIGVMFGFYKLIKL